MPQHALLLDRRRFGVALGHDQPPQRCPVLAGNLLPHFLPIVVAETDAPVGVALVQKDAPARLRHAHVAVRCPALGVHRGRGAQVHVGHLEIFGAEIFPPLQEFRLPVLQRALQRAVRAQIDIVWNAVLVIDAHYTLSQSNRAFEPDPNNLSAPCSPVELGRINTQFCHAERRPKILVSSDSSPGKRRLASNPISASGDRLARSSMATRTSSSQSRSSGATVISPRSSACSGPSGLPCCCRRSASLPASPLKRVSRRLRPLTSGSSPKLKPSRVIFGAPPSS